MLAIQDDTEAHVNGEKLIEDANETKTCSAAACKWSTIRGDIDGLFTCSWVIF